MVKKRMALETEEATASKQGQDVLSVSVRFGELSAEFSGTPEYVIRSLNSFFAKEIPNYSLSAKLALKYGTLELVEIFADYVKISPEGPVLMVGEKKLSDKQLVSLRLVAQEIAYETGNTESNSLKLSELQQATGLSAKTTSSRLSELSKSGFVARESKNGISFRITTLGINSLIDTLNKKERKNSNKIGKADQAFH